MRKNLSLLLLILLISVHSFAQVTKTISVTNAGTLTELLTVTEKSTITDLTVTGSLDARDFKCLRDELTVLSVLDLSGSSIVSYSGNGGTFPASWGSAVYPQNVLPQYAFNKDVTVGKLSLKNVVLPLSITAIGNFAFQYCANLTNVTLPESLNSIGNNAFYSCTNLTNFIIPDNVTSIGSSAYQFCHALTSITFGSNLNEIGNQAFYECHNLKIIDSRNTAPPVLLGDPFGFTYLSMIYVPDVSINAYKSANGWKLLNIGTSSLITINNTTAGGIKNAFASQTQVALSSITKLKVTGLLNSSDIYLIRDSLKILMEIDLSDAILSNNTLPSGAFQGKGILMNVKLPESVIVIGDNAFSACVNLNSQVPLTASLTTIGNGAFYNCKLMTGNMILPSNVQTIGNNAFDGCRSLTGSIVLPSNVVSIGNSAFKDCVGLTGSLVLPQSVVTLGSYAFQNCTGLNGSLTLSGNLTKIPNGTFAACSNLKGSLTVPLSVKTIEGSAFTECSKLTELSLPKNLTSIGDEAFYSCSGLTIINSSNATPPTINLNTFGYVNKSTCQVKVPVASKSAYQAADYWKLFTNIVEISDTAKITIQVGIGGKVKEGGLVLPNDTVLKVLSGAVKTFTIVPDEGYEIDALTYKGADVKNNLIGGNQYTPAIDVDATIKVTFKRFYTINVKIGAGGTVKENNVALTDNQSIKLYSGDIRTFTILPGEGFEVDSITYGGQKLTLPLVNNQFTTPAAAKNDTLAVTFKATTLTYDITFEIGAGGGVKENNVIKVNGDVLTVPVNGVRTFTFEFDKGYQIDSLFYGGKNVTAQITNINEFVTPAIVANSTLKVTFKTVPYVIQIKDAASKGTINLFVNYGDTPSFNITPESSWKVNTVKFNDVDITPDINGIYKLPAVTADGLLVVSYVNLTASPVIGISNVKVYTNHSDIVIEGISANEPISVYTVNGARVYNLKSSGDRTVIPTRPNAVYLVKTAGMTYKVIL